MKTLLAAAAALAVSGCATGTNFDWTTVQSLRPGMTRAEVTSVMGKPYMVKSQPDGSRRLIWSRASMNMMGSTKSKAVSLDFDATDKLIAVPVTPDP